MAGRLGAPNTGRLTTTSITAQGNEAWLAFQDGFFRLPNLAEAVFERAQLTDPRAVSWAAATSLSEAVALADLEPIFRVMFFEAVADALTLSESGYQQPVLGIRAPLDVVSISESFYITRPMGRTAADTIRMRDATVSAPVVVAQDVVDFADAALAQWIVSVNEAVAASDAVALQSYLRATVSDPVRLRASLLTAYAALAAEGVVLGDAASTVRALALIDRLGIDESALARATMQVSLADAARLADSLRRFFGGDVVEGLTVAPLLAASRVMRPVVADMVGIVDATTAKLILRITATDKVSLDDVDALRMVFRPSLQDGVEVAAAYVQPGNSVVTWALNLSTGAVTEYQNYAFNSFTQIAPGRYIGASDSGIYELHGEDDDGTPIMAAIRSGFMQVAGSRFAGFKAVYLGLRGTGDYLLKVEEGDGTTRTYKIGVSSMETAKVQIGKGLRARYFAFELLNEDGQDFDLDTIEFVPMYASRRV